jgi:hypothetical protein
VVAVNPKMIDPVVMTPHLMMVCLCKNEAAFPTLGGGGDENGGGGGGGVVPVLANRTDVGQRLPPLRGAEKRAALSGSLARCIASSENQVYRAQSREGKDRDSRGSSGAVKLRLEKIDYQPDLGTHLRDNKIIIVTARFVNFGRRGRLLDFRLIDTRPRGIYGFSACGFNVRPSDYTCSTGGLCVANDVNDND